MPPCLTFSIIMSGSSVSCAPPTPLYLSAVAIEKGAFKLSSTTVDQLTYWKSDLSDKIK